MIALSNHEPAVVILSAAFLAALPHVKCHPVTGGIEPFPPKSVGNDL